MNYLVEWGHAYITHFGAWVSFMFGATIYKDGLPENTSKVFSWFKVALVLALVLSIFSSHSHIHYLSHLKAK